MKVSSFGWIALALASTMLTVGCHKAQKVTPEATTSPTASPTTCPTTCPSTSPTSSPTSEPSSVPAATWTFGGPATSESIVAASTPNPLVLTPYQGITVSNIQFPVAVSGSGSLAVSEALNLADGYGTPDVTPNTLPADNATVGTAPIVYLSFYNDITPPTNMDFGTQTPAVTVSGAVLGADTTCELDVYGPVNGGTVSVWTATGATATQSGSIVSIPSATLAGGASEILDPGQTIYAVACE